MTCVCMLGYWMWDAVPIWFLYASVLIVGHCADLVPVCFGIGCGVLCRFIFLGIRPAALLVMDCFEAVFCMLRCWLWDAVPIWFLYSSVLDVERCADLFLYIVFFGHWAECTFASIVCSLRLNFQPGMWQRYGLPHPRRTVHSIHHTKKKTATPKSETAVLSSHIIHRKSRHRKKSIC